MTNGYMSGRRRVDVTSSGLSQGNKNQDTWDYDLHLCNIHPWLEY